MLPFAMGLELMAAAAAPLFPGRKLVSIKKIKAHDWLAAEDTVLPLLAEAALAPGGGEARVTLCRRGSDIPALTGEFTFGAEVPASPGSEDFTLQAGAGDLQQAEIYPQHLFHGPAFRSLVSFQDCGGRGAESILQVPVDCPGTTGGNFLTAPVLLDGAGQTVGLWAIQHLPENYVIFPTGVERIDFFGPGPSRAVNRCRAEILELEAGLIRSAGTLSDAEGAVWARITGLRHKRLAMPELVHFFRGSREVLLSQAWQPTVLPEALTAAGSLAGGEGLDFRGADGRILRAVVAQIILSRRERQLWYGMKASEQRRTDWLLGRLAAKEAIRRLLARTGEADVWSADLEILPGVNGAPLVSDRTAAHLGWRPTISLSHSGGQAAAMAARLPAGGAVGLDIEPIRVLDDAFEQLAFGPQEQKLLASLAARESRCWPLLCWCAKEAAYKALAPAAPGELRLTVEKVEEQSGRVTIKPAWQVPSTAQGAQPALEVRVFQEEKLAAAFCLRPGIENRGENGNE